MHRYVRFTVLVLTFAVFILPGVLQATTRGELFGIVRDSEGNPLPGVTVTVGSPVLQGTRAATTDNAGEYRFPLLPPGTYRLEMAMPSFERLVRENVIVSLDQATRVNASLRLAQVTEAVTVTDDVVVIDPTQTNTRQNFKEDHLKYASIGQAGRTYQNVLQQAGGVAGGSNPNVFGANSGQNVYLLDGLNTTDPVTHTFGSNLVFDAIQEISLQTGGFEAEYGKAVGGIINVITKSGGNNFSGTLDVRYSTEDFTEQGEKRQAYPPGNRNLRYNKNTQEFQNLKPAATLGGPVLRDRIWFFGSAERIENKNQPPNTNGFLPGRRDFFGWNLLGKITATPFANQTVSLKYANDFADIPYAQNNSTTRPEAGRIQEQGGYIYNLSYDAVLTRRWLANIQGGINNSYLDSRPLGGDILTTGVVDRVTGIASVNFTNRQPSQRDRTEVLGSTTYYLEALGSHAFKIGADLEWTKFVRDNNPTGTPLDPSWCSPQYGQPPGVRCGAIDRPSSGQPDLYDVITILPQLTFKGNGKAFFAQDEWRPVPQLTAKLGVRYDQNTFFRDDGKKAKSLTRFQPRIGAAWDLFNSSSTILRAHAGEFMDDNALTLSSYLRSLGSVTSRFQWNRTQQRYVFLRASGGASGNMLDPSLRPTYSQEINVGITQRIFRNTSLDVTGVYRKSKKIFEDSCVNGTCAPPNTAFWMTNRPNGLDVLKSRYKGVILKVESRPMSWMNWLFTYTLSESKGSIGYTQNAGSDFDVFPENFVNRYGYLGDDARHRVKLDGFVKLPWQIIFGTNVYWDSGEPYSVTRPVVVGGTEFLEPRGSRRVPDFYQWDVQLQKDFVLGPLRAGLIGSVFNVLDTEIATGRDGSVGSNGTVANPRNARFNFDTSWQRPRRYEVGFRVEF